MIPKEHTLRQSLWPSESVIGVRLHKSLRGITKKSSEQQCGDQTTILSNVLSNKYYEEGIECVNMLYLNLSRHKELNYVSQTGKKNHKNNYCMHS